MRALDFFDPTSLIRLFFVVSVLSLVIPSAAAPALSGNQRRLVPDDLLRLEELSDPQISPAGDAVAFVVTRYGEDRIQGSDIWLVRTDGSASEPLTSGPEYESAPRWSPDGKALGWIVQDGQSGDCRIHVFPWVAGREPRDFRVEGRLKNFKWSPDSGAIACLVTDPPSEKERERIARKDDALVVGRAEKHTRLWVLDTLGGEMRPLTGPGMTVWHFNWSPDGTRLAILASASPAAEGMEYRSRLSVVDAASGAETVLCRKTSAQAAPSFSPDGSRLVFLGPLGRFKERGTAKVIPVAGGTPEVLLEDLEGSVWDVAWNTGDDAFIAAVARGTVNTLSSVRLDGGVTDHFEICHSIIPYWGTHWSVSRDGRHAAFLGETTQSPPEVWYSRLDGSGRKRLTHFNRHLDGVKLGAVETVRWTHPADGAVVEGVVVFPPEFESGKRYPLIAWLHGGPAYNWGIGVQIKNWAQLFASRGYLVLLPNFRGSSGYGMEWMTANVRDWGDGPMSDVISGVESLVRRGWADRDRLFVGGRSYGGYLTAWIVTHSDTFRAACTAAGVSDVFSEYALTDEPSFLVGYFSGAAYDDPEIYRRNSPVTFAAGAKTPTLIVHGEKDRRVPVSQAYQLHSALTHFGVETELVVYPREGHAISEYEHRLDQMNRVLRWFENHDAKEQVSGEDEP